MTTYNIGMSIDIIMIIVWAAVIVASLIIEFLSYDLVTIFFVPAALIVLILAALSVVWWVHIIVFVVLALAFTLAFRPLLKKTLIKETIPTTVTETNKGQRVRLLENSEDGYTTILVNGVTWTAKIEGGINLEKDAVVEIIGSESNKFIVKPVAGEAS